MPEYYKSGVMKSIDALDKKIPPHELLPKLQYRLRLMKYAGDNLNDLDAGQLADMSSNVIAELLKDGELEQYLALTFDTDAQKNDLKKILHEINERLFDVGIYTKKSDRRIRTIMKKSVPLLEQLLKKASEVLNKDEEVDKLERHLEAFKRGNNIAHQTIVHTEQLPVINEKIVALVTNELHDRTLLKDIEKSSSKNMPAEEVTNFVYLLEQIIVKYNAGAPIDVALIISVDEYLKMLIEAYKEKSEGDSTIQDLQNVASNWSTISQFGLSDIT